jgi:hypothetical protein
MSGPSKCIWRTDEHPITEGITTDPNRGELTREELISFRDTLRAVNRVRGVENFRLGQDAIASVVVAGNGNVSLTVTPKRGNSETFTVTITPDGKMFDARLISVDDEPNGESQVGITKKPAPARLVRCYFEEVSSWAANKPQFGLSEH